LLILGYEWDDLLNLHCWESDIRGFGIHARKRTIKSIKLGDVGQGWNVSPPMIQAQHMQPTSSDPQPKLRNPSIRTPVYVIRSADDLSVLRRGPGCSRSFVVLEIPGMSPKQALRWESRLNDRLRECGCAAGALCAVTALLVSVFWQSFYRTWGLWSWPSFLLRTALLVIAGGGLGKLIGLGYAETDIQRITSRLRRLAQRSSQEGGR